MITINIWVFVLINIIGVLLNIAGSMCGFMLGKYLHARRLIKLQLDMRADLRYASLGRKDAPAKMPME